MEVQAVFGWAILILLTALGGLISMFMAHMKECATNRMEVGKFETKVENLDDEVTKLRRVCHRHTASIGKLNYKTGIDDEDRDQA